MSLRHYTTFFLDDQLFGLDILHIREINKQLDLTVVPHAPESIRGLINLRGQIVTLMDLKKRLGFGECQLSEETHNIVLKTDAELHEARCKVSRTSSDESAGLIPDKVGLLVDGIGDVVAVEDEHIEAPPANVGLMDTKYMLGVVQLENSLLTLLDIQPLLLGVEAHV